MIYEECKSCKWFEGCCYNPDRKCVLTKYNHILITGTYNENFDFCDELWRDVKLTL